jgi:transposase
VPKPFPIEFRRDVVAVARKGQAPLSQIASNFGISESRLHRWAEAGGYRGRNPAGCHRPMVTFPRPSSHVCWQACPYH